MIHAVIGIPISYTTAADTGSTGCFLGASVINATPMTTKKATPINSLREIRLRDACTAITVA